MRPTGRLVICIVKSIILQCTPELVLRSHWESLGADPSVNAGRFLELLKFRTVFDKTLLSYFGKWARNYAYFTQ